MTSLSASLGVGTEAKAIPEQGPANKRLPVTSPVPQPEKQPFYFLAHVVIPCSLASVLSWLSDLPYHPSIDKNGSEGAARPPSAANSKKPAFGKKSRKKKR